MTSDSSTSLPSPEPTIEAKGGEAVYVATMMRCLADAGWEVRPSGRSYEATFPNDQADQFMEDARQCQRDKGYPTDEDEVPPVSPEKARELYAALVDVTPCVREQGYTVSQPPSEAAFVEALIQMPIPVWHPFEEAARAGREDVLEEACPIEWVP